MTNKLFHGIMPALITPLDSNSQLKPSGARAIINWQLSQGVHGFYINGSTGEGPVLSEGVRMELAELAVDTIGKRAKIINHIGSPDTQSALRLARHAGQIGCDAVSSLAPNFIYRYSEQQVIDYYRRACDESGLPMLVYCTNLIGTDPVAFISKVIKVPGVIGLKYTMPDYYSMHRIVELNGGNINVINGPDETLLCGLIMGADGGIGSTYNLMGSWYVELYKAWKDNNIESARQKQFQINRVIEVLLAYGGTSAIKAALNAMGMDAGSSAYPAQPLNAEETSRLITALREVGYTI